MIVRIVKMTFKEEYVADFLKMFHGIKNAIAKFKGCQSLSLMQSIESRNVIFTYSSWKSTDALEHYRQSELFRDTWTKTKVGFAKPAEAWSVEILESL